MRAPSRGVIGFGAVALIGGYAASALGTAAGFNAVLAPLALVVMMAAFGWTRRGSDVLDVFVPSFAVAYAGFLGIALARVPHTLLPHKDDAWYLGPLIAAGPLSNLWPVVLVGGAIAALILSIAVALPLSMIPVRHARDPGANAEFFAFLDERAKRG